MLLKQLTGSEVKAPANDISAAATKVVASETTCLPSLFTQSAQKQQMAQKNDNANLTPNIDEPKIKNIIIRALILTSAGIPRAKKDFCATYHY